MIVTITHNVNRCSDCPHLSTTMDGPTCILIEKMDGPYTGLVYPEGRDKIHKDCPINYRRIV